MGSPTGVIGPLDGALQDWASGPATRVPFAVDGENAGGVRIDYRITNASGNLAIITLEPNALTTNQFLTFIQADSSGVAKSQPTDLRIGVVPNGQTVVGWLEMMTKSGQVRAISGKAQRLANGGTEVAMYTFEGQHSADAASVVYTTIDVVSDVANGIGAGSWITVRNLYNPRR